MAKLRVSQHSGRQGSAKHNDRSFLSGLSEQEVREIAPHISEEKVDNYFWCWQKQTGAKDFEKAEREFYEERYSASVEATNERYIREGHADRCKTTDDLLKGKLTRPEEVILQIGDMKSDVNGKDFVDCVKDYVNRLLAWNREHGEHMQILDIAIHMDETSPHAHVRRVWEYTDKDGLLRLGQNKGLEQAGVSLPDPDKQVSRYNNRKMSFDAMAREMWQETCKAHGFDIETEPRPSMKHKDKVEYINTKLSEALETIERAEGMESRIEALESRSRILTASQVQDTEKKAKKSFLQQDKVVLPLADYEALLSTARAAEEALNQTERMINERKKILEEAEKEASSIIEEASSLTAQIDNKYELSKFKALEKAFPKEFKEMRETLQIQNHSRSDQEHGRGR